MVKLNSNFSFEIDAIPFNKNNIPEYDICITCPPYDNKECYSENDVCFNIDEALNLKNSMIAYNKKIKDPFALIENKKTHFKKEPNYEYIFLNV